MIHHPTVTVTAAIEADTPEQALEFLQHRVETARDMADMTWGTPLARPLFAIVANEPGGTG